MKNIVNIKRVISRAGSPEPESRDLAAQKISPLRFAPVEMTIGISSSQTVYALISIPSAINSALP